MVFLSNKFISNILACGLILCSPLHALPKKGESQEWKKLTETKNGFTIDFPTEPDHIEQKIDIPQTDLHISYNTYISEPNANVVYVVSVWNYPAEIDMSKPEVNLQDGFGGMLSALPGSEVISMQMSEVQGYKSLEFLVKSEDIFFQGKLILVHNTLYQVFTVYKERAEIGEDYAHFIDSFQLLSPEQHKVEKKESKPRGQPTSKTRLKM